MIKALHYAHDRVGLDQGRDRAAPQARSIVDHSVDPDEVTVALVLHFLENRSGATVMQISAAQQARADVENAGVDVIPEGVRSRQ
ncbi:MAG: hypothetical protein ACQET5_02885 [Halobacteriota archaeon]|uniref:hypothetical protein n=1 Tax=Natronomonas sp. TaxID=2184060 RepID=UPI0039758131